MVSLNIHCDKLSNVCVCVGRVWVWVDAGCVVIYSKDAVFWLFSCLEAAHPLSKEKKIFTDTPQEMREFLFLLTSPAQMYL